MWSLFSRIRPGPVADVQRKVPTINGFWPSRLPGLLRAESKFHRVKGHRGMGSLLKTLERLIRGGPSGEAPEVT